MSIDIDSIMSKAQKYAESSKGKSKMKNCIIDAMQNNGGKLGSGKSVIPEDRIREAVEMFMTSLKSHAESYDLPASVMYHISSASSSAPVLSKDHCTVDIYFGGDMSRESLYNDSHEAYYDKFDGYTGEGINNIVALFNNGAHAKKYVYGLWFDHNQTGAGRGAASDSFAYVRSRKDRPELRFIQQAVKDFNDNYGSKYNIDVRIAKIYQEKN